MRKHWRQMTVEEQRFLQHWLAEHCTPKTWRHVLFCEHYVEEIINDRYGRITLDEMRECFCIGSVIEVNNNGNSLRIVLRAPTSVKYDTTIVYDVSRNIIITAYRNTYTDGHKTLDRGAYQWEEDIREVFGRFGNSA